MNNTDQIFTIKRTEETEELFQNRLRVSLLVEKAANLKLELEFLESELKFLNKKFWKDVESELNYFDYVRVLHDKSNNDQLTFTTKRSKENELIKGILKGITGVDIDE